MDKVTIGMFIKVADPEKKISFIDKDGVITEPDYPAAVEQFGRWLFDREVKGVSAHGDMLLVTI